MVDFIQSKFNELASKCIERNAKEYNTPTKDIQLVFKLGNDGETEYLIFKEYKPTKVLSFMEVLGVKIDFKGYSLFVPNFIKGSLNKFCDEEKIPTSDVKVLLMLNDKKELIMFLYNGNTYIKRVELESLFDSESILKQQI
jgi:hypothetical protein